MENFILPKIIVAGKYDSELASPGKSQSPMRKTTCYQLDLLLHNGGEIFADGETTPITDDLVVLVKPGVYRRNKFPMRTLFVHFILDESKLSNLIALLPTFMHCQNKEAVKTLFENAIRYQYAPSLNDQLSCVNSLLEIFHLLALQHQTSFSYQNSKTKLMEKAIFYIKAHLEEDLSLEKVAAYAMLSPTYFHNAFKQFTGQTLHDFVEKNRIEKAKSLLANTDMSLSEIAFACGFSSQSYFSYSFKRRMKMTPREYSLKHRNL